MMRNVVVLGGGFGGVRVAQILARSGLDIHITIIDRNHDHAFSPDLYEVATAFLPEPVIGYLPIQFDQLKRAVAYPLEYIFLDDLNVSLLEDEVIKVDPEGQRVLLKKLSPCPYDVLVVALGSEPDFFNISGLREYAIPLKSVTGALAIRNAIDEAFSRIPKHRRIIVAVGGGGFTGCEFAGELVGYLRKLSRLHGRSANNAECIIIEASSTLMGGASAWIRQKTTRRLQQLGVKILLESPIAAVSNGAATLKNGDRIFFDVLVWTAGVSASPIARQILGVIPARHDQVAIDHKLRIAPYENIFGVGDIIQTVDARTGEHFPMTASGALRHARYAAENIKRYLSKKPLKKFTPHHAGFIVPLGGKYGLFASGNIRLAGFIPWIMKRCISLFYWMRVLGIRKGWRLWARGMRIFIRND